MRESEEVFVISVAAELAGMHAQTLRTYDRLGIVTPRRTRGGGRRYSRNDVELLRTVQHLSQEEGVNLAGIKSIIELKQENARLREELADAQERIERLERTQRASRGELVHVPRSTAVVMWEPRRRRKAQ
ncbi:heat shock protein transcriptional repressor HspR [Corynebacterium gerontici]|uniref:Heat shock protein HspR n=1 Tax=Corynebacterium gerontici TaxID=2079234 RepID=A0A3G6IXT1_9CORY|nr:MerR family transcriptional regulator [Corynebacterium gerontici]AZA10581.1 Putative heat shock protein HspR [Corynebacterium gerontici]